jgi:hypothetical protein
MSTNPGDGAVIDFYIRRQRKLAVGLAEQSLDAGAFLGIQVKGQHRAITNDVHLDDDRFFCHRGSSHKGTEASATGVPEAGASPNRRSQVERRRRLPKRNPKRPGRQGVYVWYQTQLIWINATRLFSWQVSAISALQAAEG